MKYQKLIYAVFLFCISINAQNRLNDNAIVSQHKRMVFERWGDWRPYGKWFLGVQTNFAYATVWGMWSPKRNKDYKNGQDIRPLKPTGLEVQRLLELEVQKQEAEKIKAESDSIYKRNVQDFAHWTSATVDADPLWVLYYKRMLNPLKSFPEQPQNFREWGFDNPRGKRFLMYHETLMGWRKFKAELFSYNTKGELYLDYKNALDKFRKGRKKYITRTDVEIVQEIMNQYKDQY